MAEPNLRDVSARLLDPPYPADTRAAGWRFQLDTTRIRQSDTWTLARPEIRPWLLMLWMVAWEQSPCGSLPADEGLIAAKLGIDSGLFEAHRKVILRGWIQYNDMRLYHAVVTSQVIEMIEFRQGNNARQKRFRDRVTVSNALVTTEREGKGSIKNKGTTVAAPVDNSAKPAKPVDNSGKWWATTATIEATGRTVGVLAAPGETRDALFHRVKSALKAQKP